MVNKYHAVGAAGGAAGSLFIGVLPTSIIGVIVYFMAKKKDQKDVALGLVAGSIITTTAVVLLMLYIVMNATDPATVASARAILSKNGIKLAVPS